MSERDLRELKLRLEVLEKSPENRMGRELVSFTLPDSDVYMMLGKGPARWLTNAEDGSDSLCALDVVQIGWRPHVFGEKPLKDKPKRSCDFFYSAFEESAKRMGRMARFECVHSAEYGKYLVEEKGYAEQPFCPTCYVKLVCRNGDVIPPPEK